MSNETWLISRKVDASKKIFVVTEILLFDFELFIGVQCVFIPFNNHKIMFYKYLYVLKARVILENYNFLYN